MKKSIITLLLLVMSLTGYGETLYQLERKYYENNTIPFLLAVQQGLIEGYKVVDKFGENPDIDTTSGKVEIWEGLTSYIYDDIGTAPIVSIASNSVLDTQTVEITGLDIGGNEVVQVITLAGTTRQALTTPLWRVYRMANVSLAGGDLNGTIFCYTGTGAVPTIGDATIRAIIDNGNNQTLMAMYTIPRGYVGFLYRGELGMSRNKNTGAAQCGYYSRRYGKVFRIKKRVDITNQGTSIYQDDRIFPDVIPSLTDIKLTVEEVSDNDTGVFGTFFILLIDESKFSVEYLQSIEQPGY